MLWEGIHNKQEDEKSGKLTMKDLLIQGIATSIDALSVGFTIASYNLADALLASFLIGAVTFVICLVGVRLGRRFGTLLAGKANIVGGIILIGIGLEIFLTGLF